MQIIDASNINFEAVAATAEKETEAVNEWLASLPDKAALDRELHNRVWALAFGPNFEQIHPCSRQARNAIVNDMKTRMTGADADLKFDYGMAGSIWIDAEFRDIDTNQTRLLRIDLVTKNARPSSWELQDHRFVMVIHCLEAMYS
jgi:hypothetical protein